MKLEIGKEYATRDGQRAKVVAHEPRSTCEPYVGYIYHDPAGATAESWLEDGRWSLGEAPRPLDLVSEYVPPKPRLLGWVNVEGPAESFSAPAVGVARFLPAGTIPKGRGDWVRAPWLDEPVAAEEAPPHAEDR